MKPHHDSLLSMFLTNVFVKVLGGGEMVLALQRCKLKNLNLSVSHLIVKANVSCSGYYEHS